MKSWMSSATWDAVFGGLYSDGEFLSYMYHANNPSMPGWCMTPIFEGRNRLVHATTGWCMLRIFNGRSCQSRKKSSAKREQTTIRDLRTRSANWIPRRAARAARFPSFPGLAFFCWILHELRIKALGGVGAAHFPVTAARGHKRKFGDCLPSLQSRQQGGAHRRLEMT
jgi:hypothetical protein